MLLMFSLFIFFLPIFGGLTRINNLFHLSLLLFIGMVVVCRREIYTTVIKGNHYQQDRNGIIFIAAFLFYYSISGLWSEPALKISSELTHSIYILCFLVIFKVSALRLNRIRVYSIIVTAIVLLCILTLIFADKSHIFVSRLNYSFPWAPNNVIDLGGYFSVGIFLLFMIIRDTGKKWLYLPALLLFSGLLLTQSRNPIFSLIIASLPLLLLIKKNNFQHVVAIMAILVLVGIIIFFTKYDHNLLVRIGKSYNESFIRFGIWQNAFDLFLQKPILGWGFGKELNFINSVNQHIHTTHSLYLAVLLKGGVIGMITFLLMIGYGMKIAFHAFCKGYGIESCLFIFSLLFYATQGMFVIENPNTSWILFWLPMAVLYSTTGKLSKLE